MQKDNKKKVLITGASGFIGGFLVKEALQRGYEVWAGVRKSSNTKELTGAGIHLIDLCYHDLPALNSQIKEQGKWDFVIHNAGLTKTTDKKQFDVVNATYTHHLIQALHAANCEPEKFLLMSSLSSFGKGDETDFTPIRITDEQKPDTVYGNSKLKGENFLRSQSWFPYVILRPTGVYVPGV